MNKSAEELIYDYTQLFRDFDSAITVMAKTASENLEMHITKKQIIESFYSVMEMSNDADKPIEILLKEALATATKEAEESSDE